MNLPFFENSLETAARSNPADGVEAETDDESLKMTAETYNRITQWIIAGGSFEKIGLRALCIHRCAGRPSLPTRGLFESLENKEAEQMAQKMICAVLGWVIKGRTLTEIGHRTMAAFCAIRRELSGQKSLAGIARRSFRTKQAVSKIQKTFRKKMGMRVRRSPGRRVVRRVTGG